jgi:SAM-dependent methyltransferase
MKFDKILTNTAKYYDERLVLHGATARGVDWNSQESQFKRFEQLLKVCDGDQNFSINDYGCGYGGLIDYIARSGYRFKYYYGFDISNQMINKAKEIYRDFSNLNFFSEKASLSLSEYTVASGIFNVKLEVSDEEWKQYILNTLQVISNLSVKGFSFNALTQYSDPERMISKLYYADPCYFFDYCKKNFSRNVSLFHDYDLYEFTLVVRK